MSRSTSSCVSGAARFMVDIVTVKGRFVVKRVCVRFYGRSDIWIRV
jgi:hypothetical protein